MLTAEQINERKNYIGGSDAAAVLGLSRWRTPLEVWAEKTGQIEPKNISDKVCVKLGNKLESTVAEFFTDETGKKVVRVNETIYHPDYPFLAANIDRRVVGEDAILEAKTCSAWKKKEWEDQEIPQEYIIQCMHYLAVTGKERCYLAVLIGNEDFKYKIIQRDKKFIKDLIDKEVSFWNNFVLTGAMPGQITANDNNILFELYPKPEPESVILLDDTANTIIESLQGLEADKKSVEAIIEQQKNELKAMLKDKETGATTKYRVTWKAHTRKSVDTDRLKKEEPTIYENFSNITNLRVLKYGSVKEK